MADKEQKRAGLETLANQRSRPMPRQQLDIMPSGYFFVIGKAISPKFKDRKALDHFAQIAAKALPTKDIMKFFQHGNGNVETLD